MGSQREAQIAGRKLLIWEHEDVVEANSGRSVTGSWIWDCSFLLADWLASGVWAPGYFQGKRVVELGAGTGLPGMVAAVLGAHVVLTDRPYLLHGLQKNVEANSLTDSVKVKALEWGEDCSHCSPPVDLVLMSDLLYDLEAMPQLCDSLLRLSAVGHTQILVAYEMRLGTTECLQSLWDSGFLFAPQELPPGWPHHHGDDIGLLTMWRALDMPSSPAHTSLDLSL